MTDVQAIRNQAEAALIRFREPSNMGAAFGYNRETVAWFESFIEEQRSRDDLAEQDREDLARLIGCHLGECLIRTYGGTWRERDGVWGVFFNSSNAVFPFSKVGKQFANGIEGGDSILGLFDVIASVFPHLIN